MSGQNVTSRIFSAHGELAGAILAGALLLAGWLFHWTLGDVRDADAGGAGAFVAPACFWLSLAVGMVFGLKAAWDALRDKRVDIDVLMVVGAGLAAAIGHPEEGALLLFLFTLSGALEELAAQRTQREITALHAMLPKAALVLRSGQWVEADAESLVPDELVRIRPGERVPVDAVVTEGASSIDQSAITGESVPREVAVGDELFAGTVNSDDPLTARVLRPARESSLQKILDLVTTARDQREPVQRLIDRFSQPYTIVVLSASLAVALIWWLVLGAPLVASGEASQTSALYVAITLLIVASPCALVIATPTATLAAIARLARGGVLVKGGQALVRLANIGSVAFDKTGTLTFGRPRLYEVHPVAWSDGQRLLALAAGLEADSTHPIAQAVKDAATVRGVAPIVPERTDHVVAKGIEGVVQGRRVRLGRLSFCEELVPMCFRSRVREVLERIQHRGHIGVVIAAEAAHADEQGEVAVLIMADAVRPGATELVESLHALGVRPVRMLTGDNRTTAERIATALRLDAFDAELLPEDKLRIVGEMRDAAHAGSARRGAGVAVIGDGVNDAPALARADVGIGIGTIGTAAALESADVVLLSDNLAAVPWSIDLARTARRTIIANLGIALGVIVIMSIVTLVASRTAHPLPLSVGVLAHEGGTVLVVLNSLRLLAFRSPRPAPEAARKPAQAQATKAQTKAA